MIENFPWGYINNDGFKDSCVAFNDVTKIRRTEKAVLFDGEYFLDPVWFPNWTIITAGARLDAYWSGQLLVMKRIVDEKGLINFISSAPASKRIAAPGGISIVRDWASGDWENRSHVIRQVQARIAVRLRPPAPFTSSSSIGISPARPATPYVDLEPVPRPRPPAPGRLLSAQDARRLEGMIRRDLVNEARRYGLTTAALDTDHVRQALRAAGWPDPPRPRPPAPGAPAAAPPEQTVVEDPQARRFELLEIAEPLLPKPANPPRDDGDEDDDAMATRFRLLEID